MIPKGTVQQIKTSLLLGIQLDESDFSLFLRDYHREMQDREGGDKLPEYSAEVVLDDLLFRCEKGEDDRRAGRRFEALSAFAARTHGFDLALTGSDYGSLEQRKSPYSFDRTFYHLGQELVCATVDMDFPGYNPFRSTRRLDIGFVRENLDRVLEFLPDYLWWSLHDQRDQVVDALATERLDGLVRRIELAGLQSENFGLYLATQEYLLLPEELDAMRQESEEEGLLV